MIMRNKLELLSTIWMVILITIGVSLYFGLWFVPIARPFLALYTAFIIFDKAPERGGRAIPWFQNWVPLYKYIGNYFEAELHREVPLSPDDTYIFGYHPHGVISFGLQACIGPCTKTFEKLFPGIKMNLLTLNVNFFFPFYRDFFMAVGACSVSKKSIQHLLSRGKGSSVAIAVGGGAESLYAQPHMNKLVIRNRKGFVKLAIQNGAQLVPVYCFGENHLYSLMKSEGLFFTTIEKVLKVTGIYFPQFVGRGFFEGSLGIFPRKVKLHVVVGEPVKVTKNENPSQEEIDSIHQTYLNGLTGLYDKYKSQYHPDSNPPELEFVNQ